MKLSELKGILELYSPTPSNDPQVVVRIQLPYSTVGGQPSMPVKQVYGGFDWDHGKFFIHTEESLTKANNDFAEQFKKLQDDYGKVSFENRKLKKRIAELEKK